MKRKNVVKTKQEKVIANSLRLTIFSLLIVIMGAIASPASAQCTMQNKAFSAGECITYDLYFNWKFIWLKAGIATLSTNGTTINSEPGYQIDLLSISSKRVDFFFKMRDTLTSVITQRLEPHYYRKGALEGKHYSVDEAWFSYKDGLSIVEQTRTYKDGGMVQTTDSSSSCIFDMLSILAHARSYDFNNYKEGERIYFNMATGKKVVQESLLYEGKQNIKADDGNSYRCLVFTFVEHGEVTEGPEKDKNKEVVTFYVTDDENHIPIRLDFYLNFGSAKAFMKSIVGNRYPLTSLIQ